MGLNWAEPEYEPTPEEVRDVFDIFLDNKSGHHGSIELLPTMERYIWNEDVWWHGREILPNGHIRLNWMILDPESLRHD